MNDDQRAGAGVRWVGQKQARGCGVACLAMATRRTYDDVAQWFAASDLDNSGLFQRDLDLFLFHHGYATCTRYRYEGSPKRAEQPWPIAPFAAVHLCEVRVVEGVGHHVVMFADGTVLDPLTESPRRLTDYLRVDSISGIIPTTLVDQNRRTSDKREGEGDRAIPDRLMHLYRNDVAVAQPMRDYIAGKPLTDALVDAILHLASIRDRCIDALKNQPQMVLVPKPAGEAGGWEWSKTPPRYPGLYWHWTGDPDAAPLPYTVFCREVGSCFITRGQYGIDRARECRDEPGWWLRLELPRTPPADPNIEWRSE